MFPNKSTQFQPGNPGGPGRPRKRPITERLIEQLGATKYPGWELAPGETVADMVAAEWIRLVIEDRDTAALRELLARLEGRIPVKIQDDAVDADDDSDFEEILASLGYRREQGSHKEGPGSTQPSGPGGGRKPRKVGTRETSGTAQCKARGSGKRNCGGTKSAAPRHNAAKTRKK